MTLSPRSSEALKLALARLKARFTKKPRSWFERCVERLRDVERVGAGSWVVRGRRSLGDEYPSYLVKVVGGKYRCSCQSPYRLYASRRRRQVCTHIGSVMLHRLTERLREASEAQRAG
ncbi:MAG: hypothetical protein N3H31_03745 [Candidatus Nezhaarchaeota archaeon]|nr:hypothetical protein [Candidatus Nezhaarchaeota archaeon]